MANSIASITKMLTQISEQIYGHDSLSAILDTQGVQIATEFGNAKTVKVPHMETSGLGDYSPTNGYGAGDATLTFVPYTLTKDRGKKFTLDAVDNIDSAGVALAMLESTFVRTKVVPELDAYRFAQYATGAGAKASASLDATSVIPAIDTARASLFEAGVPEQNLFLFISSTCYTALKNASDKLRWGTGTAINREVETFDGVPVVKVPASRFMTAVTLGTDGYTNPASALALNFILMDKNAVLQIVKHNPSNLITPDANQSADGWLYKYRVYHDALIKDGKAVGIYAHSVPKASS